MPARERALLFVDKSREPETGIGYGACLLVLEETHTAPSALAKLLPALERIDAPGLSF